MGQAVNGLSGSDELSDAGLYHWTADDGNPTGTGINVQITNLETGETINTTTGYPNYPPVEMYNNDYKSVFTCVAGKDRVSVKAWNRTHEGYGEIDVPIDSQALLNITLDKEIRTTEEGTIKRIFRSIIDYFTGR